MARSITPPVAILVLVLVLSGLGCQASDAPAAAESRAAAPSRLVPCGRALCTSDDSRFRWRGVTAFALADLVADNQEAQARAFVEWAARKRFNVLRVLAANHGWMSLSPEEGQRALPRVLAMAREHGMYVQVVALAGTREGPLHTEAAMRAQVRAVGELCAAAGNCVLEIANEPYHASQAGLEDPARMQRLQQEVPSDLPVTWGAAADDTSDVMAGGSFVVVHLARGGPRWDRVARARQLDTLSRRLSKFVVDNEPIGAAEKDVRDRRDSAPGAFFAQGMLSRIFEIGATFHCEDCLRARIPGPTQQHCADAFVAGATMIPDNVVVRSVDPGEPEAPIGRVGNPDAHAFTGVAESQAWVIVLGVAAPPDLTWQRGWRAVEHRNPWPDVHVWRAAHAK